MAMFFFFAGVAPPSNPPSSRPVPVVVPNKDLSNPLSQQFINKLTQLEKLQYDLTKQVSIDLCKVLFLHDEVCSANVFNTK